MSTTTPEISRSRIRALALWLFALAAAIWLMVVIGGATRLTGSGLSITEWKPILGAIPPLSEQEWQKAFDLYKQYPQYHMSNPDMDLAGFKSIYIWEYLHRLWGRAIGLVFLIPLLYFWVKGCISRKLLPKLLAIFVLGAAQGAMGWFMVKSGLIDKPWVSPYRLTAHLLLALALFGYVLWQALNLWFENEVASRDATKDAPCWLFPVTLGLLALLLVQTAFGGFMAGLHAALSYPTFPTMNGEWVPLGILSRSPLWVNFFENPATVQFVHRLLGALLAFGMTAYWLGTWKVQGSRVYHLGRHLLLGCVLIQFQLGVLTVKNSLGHIPVGFGVLHQACGVALLATVILLLHQTKQHSGTGV